MKLVRSVPIILAIILFLTAFPGNSQTAASQDACTQPLTAASVENDWTSDSLSIQREGSYSLFYTFYLRQQSDVTIFLRSPVDTYLYLYSGMDTSAQYIDHNADITNTDLNSRIERTLEAGAYTIEATTSGRQRTGHFTLETSGIDYSYRPDLSDRAALVALYNATGGDEWYDNDNWLSDAPLGEWYGVDTNDNGRVTRLDFEGNNLTGQIPKEFGDLVMLDWVNISINRLSGELPQSLTSLTRMEYLYFDTNAGLCAPADSAFQTWLQSIEYRGRTCGAPPPGSDEAALIALYHATNGPNWHRNDNWLTDAPLNEWYGVTTNEQGHVIRLDLYGNNLVGTIPYELGNLSELREIWLGNNQFTGCIPEILRDVRGNDFTDLDIPFCNNPDRDVLVAIYNATDGDNWANNTNWLTDTPLYKWHGVNTDGRWNVHELILDNNQLAGQLPPEIGEFHAVKTIDFANNQLTGAIPPELGSLDNLRWLDLYGNRLAGAIPPELGSLVNLLWLDLYGNRLTGAIPPELGDADDLEYLDVSDNQLTGAIPQELGELDYLKELYLAGNNLTGCVPDALQNIEINDFAELGLPFCESPDRAALVALYNATDGDNWHRNDNWLTDAPLGEWHGVTTDENGHVTGLELTYNDLSGRMSPELGSLTNLNILDFSGNEFEEEIPLWLVNLVNLETLDLGANSFRGNIPPELAKLGNLQTLTLGFNELTGEIPPEIGDFKNLTSLYLSVNNLSGEIPPELGNLTNLLSLSIGSNELTGDIPPEIGELASLELLSLGNNNLTGTIPPELAKLSNLKELSLRRNELTGEVPPWIGELSNLEVLGLHVNNLTGEIPAELANLTKLESLLLYYNYLSGEIPPELGALTNLIGLGLDGNNLTGKVPSEFGKLINLEGLGLSNNLLTGALPHSLTALTELEEFVFYHNAGLCAPADESFQNWLRGIEDFEGNICGVQSPPSNQDDIAALTALYNATNGDNWKRNRNWLSDTHISEWYGVTTDADGRVVRLNLYNNNLSGTIPPEISSLSNLLSFSLSRNQLTGEFPQELTELTNLTLLYFAYNAGLCAPTDAAFQQWLQSVVNVQGPTCEDEPTPTPPLSPSECSEHITNFRTYNRTLTNDCASESRTAFGDHYARQFTFTLSHPTTVEVVIRSQHIDTHIFVTDDDGETIVDIDDYIGRNAGFRKALQPGDYTIEVTTFRSAQTGDFEITYARPEFDALKALYESAGGAGWARKHNWLSDAPLSEWQGVQTDSEGRVTQVNLIANDLTGEIPSELQDLTHLEGLYLGKNELSGTIPAELGSIPALQVLMLSDNNLTGRIPAQLGNLANLHELYLSRNQLSGPIPATLGRLDNLYRLHLAANELSGGIPRDLGNLTSLRQLSMSDNKLTGSIPPQLANLDNLTHLYLWGNELTSGSFFLHLGDMDNLQFLDIGGNRIAGSQMLPELEEINNLTGLGLHDADLTNSDLLDYINDLQALDLEFLNLRSNDLSDPQILVGLSRITTLQRLAINDNDFSGQLPRSMTALTLMRIFYFNDNKGLCAPADAGFQNWLTGIRDFRGDTCAAASPTGAPAPASQDAKAFGTKHHSSSDAISEAHSLSLLESIQPNG